MAQNLAKFRAKLFKKTQKLFRDKDFIREYIVDKKHFSRKPTLDFEKVSLLILQLLKSSINRELKTFHTTIFREDQVVNWVTDSAFCKARQKISHRLFFDLYKHFVNFFYANIGGEKWHHYRLLGVDGSEINLPSCKEFLSGYGCHHVNSIGTKIPQARISFLCDVLNDVTIDAQIEPFKTGEQTMFSSHLKYVGKNDLVTADANYGHFRLLKEIQQASADFCIRMSQSPGFIKEFLASGKTDVVRDWNPSPRTKANCKKHNIDDAPLKVRLIRIDLSENETEVLAVSLLDRRTFTFDDMKGLYNCRWATEEEFKKFMQRLVIEFFSSKKENGLLQDFFANVFMQNMVSFLSEPVKSQVYQESSDCKHRQKINWTSALGDVRTRLVLLFVRSPNKVDKIIDSLQGSFIKNTDAIKPGRKFPRDKRKKGARMKASICYKPAW